MSKKNSNRFLIAFNQIEETIKELVALKEYILFSKSVELAKRKNSTIIRQYEDELRKYAEFRNAIVYHITSYEHAIAEPHKDVMVENNNGDILKHESNGNNYRFIASKTPIPEAEEIFKEAAAGGHILEAILITRLGKKEEPLTGIITPLDLINNE